MNLYNILDRYIFLPLGDLVYGSRVASKFNELLGEKADQNRDKRNAEKQEPGGYRRQIRIR